MSDWEIENLLKTRTPDSNGKPTAHRGVDLER
jgi:hypothetical protein